MELRIVEEIPDVEFISYWDEAKYWLEKWPHRYTSDNMRIRQNFEDGEWVLLDEVSDWLQQCVGNGRYMHHYSHFYFETAQDAFAFKMRFG